MFKQSQYRQPSQQRKTCALLAGCLLTALLNHGNAAEPVSPVFAATQHQLVIAGFKFAPSPFAISPGDSITWTNQDIVPHNITLKNGQKQSPDLMKGEKISMVATSSLSYICSLHPTMTGEIIVTTSRAHR